MATVSSLVVSARGVGNPSRKPYFVQTTLDFSNSAINSLSAGDIVQAITIPADTCVMYAGAEMIASVQSGADGNTVNLGIADVDQYVQVSTLMMTHLTCHQVLAISLLLLQLPYLFS